MSDWISVSEALKIVTGQVEALGEEVVPIHESLERVLGESVASPIDLPPFDNSAMDGFAFRWSEDWEKKMEIVGTSSAGNPYFEEVPIGKAIRIMTGAEVPQSCDTVVPIEHTQNDQTYVSLKDEPTKGSHIRYKSTYLKKGAPAINAFQRVDPGVISILASFGISSLKVLKKPRVAIITTGDELVPIEETPGKGQIRNSNAHLLEALIKKAGAIPYRLPIAPDNEEAIRTAFETALESADIVLSVGGVSMGEFDFVRKTIMDLVDSSEFWKVQMKPGKPLTYGRRKNKHLIGLPGNPVASFVSFHVFVAPLIAVLQKVEGKVNLEKVFCEKELRSTPKRKEFITGYLHVKEGVSTFHRIGSQSSGDPSAMAGCNALAVMDIGHTQIEAGGYVEVFRL